MGLQSTKYTVNTPVESRLFICDIVEKSDG